MQIFKWTIFFGLLFFSIHNAILFGKVNSEPKDFIVATIPKSGTHLVTKLLTLLTGYERFAVNCNSNELFELIVKDAKKNNKFVYCHSEILPVSSFFCKNHPNYIEIIVVRDLRDVLISLLTPLKTILQKEMGYQASENEILTYLLNGKGINPEYMKIRIEEITNYLQKKKVCLLRFENLIDSFAGGSNDVQRWHITHLASVLNIPLTDAGVDYICKNLMGNKEGTPFSPTFNVGKMGRWKTYYSDEQLQIFEEKWGHYQTALGYPLREDFIPCIP